MNIIYINEFLYNEIIRKHKECNQCDEIRYVFIIDQQLEREGTAAVQLHEGKFLLRKMLSKLILKCLRNQKDKWEARQAVMP